MNDNKTLLNNVGLKLLIRAIELEEKASRYRRSRQRKSRKYRLKYGYMSDGLMEGVQIIDEEIKKLKEEEER